MVRSLLLKGVFLKEYLCCHMLAEGRAFELLYSSPHVGFWCDLELTQVLLAAGTHCEPCNHTLMIRATRSHHTQLL